MNPIINLFNKNFNKGVSVYQMCLMASMIGGAIIGSKLLILFSMVNCIFGYFEPNTNRFSINLKEARTKC